jgi:hypothetical protein
MPPLRLHRSVFLTLALVAGCQLGTTRPGTGDTPTAERSGVALLLGGSAFREAAAREA